MLIFRKVLDAILSTILALLLFFQPTNGLAEPYQSKHRFLPTVSRSYAGPLDVVWNHLLDALLEGGYSLDVVQKDAGIVTTDWIPFGTSGDFASALQRRAQNCSHGAREGSMRGREKFTIRVAPSGETRRTVVTILLVVQVRSESAQDWQDCQSNATIERLRCGSGTDSDGVPADIGCAR